MAIDGTEAYSPDRHTTRGSPAVPGSGGAMPEAARFLLQRGSSRNVLGHSGRSMLRMSVLVVADLACFAVVRAGARTFGGWAVRTTDVSRFLGRVIPLHLLEGWQLAASLLLCLLVLGTYGPGDRRRDVHRLVAACWFAVALPLWSQAWTQGPGVVFIQYLSLAAALSVAVTGERRAIDWLLLHVFPRFRALPRTVLVGSKAECEHFELQASRGSAPDFRIVASVDASNLDALDGLAGFSDLLVKHATETVIVCPSIAPDLLLDIADKCAALGGQLLHVPPGLELPSARPRLVWRHGQAMIEVTSPELLGPDVVAKRLVDVIAASLGLIVLSPVFAMVALFIKLDSRGPALFAQIRVGKGGNLFKILKFRTMINNAEGMQQTLAPQSMYGDGRLFKIAGDPRTTRVGRWLRRTSLDELPQLVNVLRGDMSLVGPRPPLPSEVALYKAHHYARFDVKPGITGPWQVSGRNQILDFEQVIALETEYIRSQSFLADIAILLRTIPAVLRMRGAL